MSLEIETHIKSFLSRQAIIHEWLTINPDFADTASFCEEYGYSLSESGNTIIVASKRGEKKYAACLVLASDKLNVNKKVKSLMNVPRLSFANSEETMTLTGMLIGGVTPFGLPESVNLYIDSKVLNTEKIILGGGSRSAKILLPPDELKKIPKVEIIEDLSIN